MKKPYFFDAPLALVIVKTIAFIAVIGSAIMFLISKQQHWGALDYFSLSVYLVTLGIQDKIRADRAAGLIISLFGGALFTILALMLLQQGPVG